jgi:hypothetical protein
MSVPGIGPSISSAMVAAIGAGDAFSKGRDFAAWLGLGPRQMSTGDRTILGKISKRGNRYLRVLFVQAAWVGLIKPKSWERYGLKPWLEAAKKRLHHDVLAIAAVNLRVCDVPHVGGMHPRVLSWLCQAIGAMAANGEFTMRRETYLLSWRWARSFSSGSSRYRRT